MHVIQHIEGRDLMFKLAISEAEVAQLVTERVTQVVHDLQAKGVPITEFSDSIKTRESIITKLIAKRESVAAQIYDRTRFRIIVEAPRRRAPGALRADPAADPLQLRAPDPDREHAAQLQGAARAVRPPEEAREAAAPRRRLRGARGGQAHRQPLLGAELQDPQLRRRRADSARPVPPAPERDERQRKGRIALALCEFQICDEATAIANEQDENSHEAYKLRQRKVVLKRLSRGLVVPKRRAKKGS